MKSRVIVIILSALIVLLVSANIFMMRSVREMTSRPGPGPEFMEMGPPMMERPNMPGNRYGRHFCTPEFMTGKLNMSPEQQQKVEELNRMYDTEFQKYFSQLNPERKKLGEIIKKGNPDMAEVRKILEKMATLNVELNMLKIRQGSEIDGILTPGQKNRLHMERRMFFERRPMRPDGYNE